MKRQIGPLFGIGTLLLVLNILAGNIAILGRTTRAVLAVMFLLPFAFFYLEAAPSRDRARRWLLAPLLMSAAVWLLGSGGAASVTAVVLVLWAIILVRPRGAVAPPELPVLMLTSSLLSLLALSEQLLPQLFLMFGETSSGFSRLASLLAGREIQLGPSYSGIRIAVVFALFHFSLFVLSARRQPRLFAAALLAQTSMSLGLLALMDNTLPRLARMPPSIESGLPQLMWFAVCLPCVVIHWIGTVGRDARLKACADAAGARGTTDELGPNTNRLSVGEIISVVAAVSLLCAGIALIFHQPDDRKPLKVLLSTDGVLNWNLPEPGLYGTRNAGMFGQLPMFLESLGCRVTRAPIASHTLRDADVLVIINPQKPLDPQIREEVWGFIARGGGLLAMGDHTGLNTIREPLNDLLQPVHIALRFDSAIPFKQEWVGSLQILDHYLTHGVRAAHDLAVKIGASLDVRPPACTLIIGQHGFSDKGDRRNAARGYLGNMALDAGEQTGDIVLCAYAHYKQGRVLVFGDTTSFQNAVIAASHAFLERCFAWLGSQPRTAGVWPRLLCLGALLVLAALLVRRGSSPSFVGAVSLALTATYLGTVALTQAVAPPSRAEADGKTVWIDGAHLNRFNRQAWSRDGVGGLALTALRARLTPYFLENQNDEPWATGRSLVVIAPARRFGKREVDQIERYVQQGGHLLLSVGFEERDGARELLDRFGFALENTPLGPIARQDNTRSLIFPKAWPVRNNAAGAQTLCEAGGYAVVISRPFGLGRVILIGDSLFLLNENLEMLDTFHTTNLEFVQQLLQE